MAVAVAAALLVWTPAAGAQDRPRAPESPASRLERLRREERGPRPPSASESAARRLEIAAEYARRGETAQAVEVLGEAAARDPDNGEVLARLTLLHLARGDVEFARTTLDEAAAHTELRLGPPELWNEVAEKFAAEHRVEDAIAAWE